MLCAGTTVTLNYELAPICSQFPLFKCTVKSFVNIITKSGSVILWLYLRIKRKNNYLEPYAIFPALFNLVHSVQALSYRHSSLQLTWYICSAVDNAIKKNSWMFISLQKKNIYSEVHWQNISDVESLCLGRAERKKGDLDCLFSK